MAKPKRNIIDVIRKEYPEINIDRDIIEIINHPKFKNSMLQYINKWYIHKTPSKQRRFFIWVTKYPTGNSEKKMKILFGWDKQGYGKWTFDRRSKRSNCVEYYTIRGFSDEEAIKKVSESQKKINSDGVDKRVLSWHDTFSKKTKEEMDQINISKGLTLEKCIEKHDDLKGRFVWNEILKKKDNTSISSIMNRKGVDLDTAVQIKNNIKHKQRINSQFALEYWNNLYPDDDKFATDMFRLACSTRIHFSKKSCIEKYGEEKGLAIWQYRQDRWQETLNSKSQEEKDEMNSKKSSKYRYAYWDFPKNDIGCFYVIQITEALIKIGITYRNVNSRYRQEHLEECIVIKEEFDTLERCFALEQLLKIELKDFRILKHEKYNVFGWTETFRIDKEFLLNKIDELKSIGVVETFKNLKPGYY